MNSTSATSILLTQITKIDTNQLCFDCGAHPAIFANTSLGVFLCFECAGHHRNYTNAKNIKSTTLDEW
jgi:hypothetical protein